MYGDCETTFQIFKTHDRKQIRIINIILYLKTIRSTQYN